MGHIHHVNVVQLVGFCADGFRRALVYDFLPIGSLQEFFHQQTITILSWVGVSCKLFLLE
ncbi:putative protein kinase RLK-Pelle-LRK10L-2 family [Rosa chinensis]|uniref:Serine-threonine/tyrosine-protein kinase catalytic domain-containing protein n=1 Tax=Rosa chinensis TaxID=74649 RepID=A0A2P6SC21_ROSCH|nr:putative protein kinase RLK-Pelle-LRK10L-2 family [Rosa chinensis]